MQGQDQAQKRTEMHGMLRQRTKTHLAYPAGWSDKHQVQKVHVDLIRSSLALAPAESRSSMGMTRTAG